MAEKKPLRKVLFMPIHWAYLVVLIVVLAASFYLFYPRVESFFIYFPQSQFDFSPEEFRLQYREAFFNTEDGEKRFFFQAPWYREGQYAGFVEISFEVPEEIPLFHRG